jgi:hypothetical protein
MKKLSNIDMFENVKDFGEISESMHSILFHGGYTNIIRNHEGFTVSNFNPKLIKYPVIEIRCDMDNDFGAVFYIKEIKLMYTIHNSKDGRFYFFEEVNIRQFENYIGQSILFYEGKIKTMCSAYIKEYSREILPVLKKIKEAQV